MRHWAPRPATSGAVCGGFVHAYLRCSRRGRHGRGRVSQCACFSGRIAGADLVGCLHWPRCRCRLGHRPRCHLFAIDRPCRPNRRPARGIQFPDRQHRAGRRGRCDPQRCRRHAAVGAGFLGVARPQLGRQHPWPPRLRVRTASAVRHRRRGLVAIGLRFTIGRRLRIRRQKHSQRLCHRRRHRGEDHAQRRSADRGASLHVREAALFRLRPDGGTPIQL